MADLSNITNQSGLTEIVEFWARIPYGSSGNTLREIINRINAAFERIMPILLSYSDYLRWDDPNHTDLPIGRTNIVSGQADYKFAEDDNSLDILNITNVRTLASATADQYNPMRRMTIDDIRILEAVSPNTNNSGAPTHFAELGGRIHLFPEPDYAATNGLEIFFSREQAYFTVTGTSASVTTEPGIPKPFHEVLALYAAYDIVAVNRPPDFVSLLNVIQQRIKEHERDLKNFISMQHPTKLRIIPRRNFHR